MSASSSLETAAIESGEEPTYYIDRLTFDFDVSDWPVVKGTRVTVKRVVDLIADDWDWADILRSHPELTEDDIRACVAYAKDEDVNETCRALLETLKPATGSLTRESFVAAAKLLPNRPCDPVFVSRGDMVSLLQAELRDLQEQLAERDAEIRDLVQRHQVQKQQLEDRLALMATAREHWQHEAEKLVGLLAQAGEFGVDQMPHPQKIAFRDGRTVELTNQKGIPLLVVTAAPKWVGACPAVFRIAPEAAQEQI